MEVGRHIREGRESLGISQEELAREIFVSRQTVSNWETGKTYPDVQSLLLMSNLFDTSVDFLVKGDVEAMQKEIENYELDRFKMVMYRKIALALLVIGAILSVMLAFRGESFLSPLFIFAVLLMLAGAPFAYLADRIERNYDIETVREVQAFLSGADPDQIERDRTTSRTARLAARTMKTVAVVVLLLAVVACVVVFVALR